MFRRIKSEDLDLWADKLFLTLQTRRVAYAGEPENDIKNTIRQIRSLREAALNQEVTEEIVHNSMEAFFAMFGENR